MKVYGVTGWKNAGKTTLMERLVSEIAGVELERHHDLSAPQGVRGRNSDNTLIESRLGWSPSITLREGLERTYEWVSAEVNRAAA